MQEIIAHRAGVVVGYVVDTVVFAVGGGGANCDQIGGVNAVAPRGLLTSQHRGVGSQAFNRQAIISIDASDAQDGEFDIVLVCPGLPRLLGVYAAVRTVSFGLEYGVFINPSTLTVAIDAGRADQH